MVELLKPLNTSCIQKILNQMNYTFYGISVGDKKFGFCFFCHIKYNSKIIPVMMANYKIINENYLANNDCIKISINNKYEIIQFGNTKYFNKNYDLSIIEIKEDKDNQINFLEFDDFIYENEFYLFNKESIYCINLSKKSNISVTFGMIKNINNLEIAYLNYARTFNSISLIFNLSNNKIIGYDKSSFNKNNSNKGISFKFLISEFINEYKNYKKMNKFDKKFINEINIIIQVDKLDFGNNIYFLSNYKNKEEDLKKLIGKIYINNKELEEFKNFFIPQKEGEYNINLKFQNNYIDCSYMFYNCEKIIFINFISFESRFITDMKYMFFGCTNLKNINLLSFNTKKVTNMSYMFYGCKNLIELDLSSFDNKSVTDMSHMFAYCESLNNLNLSSFIINKDINIDEIFSYRWNLNKLDFYLYKEHIKINEIDILIKIEKKDINNKIYFLDYDYSKSKMGQIQENSNELNEFNTELYINDELYEEFEKFFIPEKEGIYNIKLKFDINLTDCSYMFYKCENIININFISCNTDEVENLEKMFYYCENLKNINFSNFNTKNVTNMNNIFYGCKNLNKLDLSNFITENVTSMNGIFEKCSNLVDLDLSSFNTKNVIYMNKMFSDCEKLKNLNIFSFDTKNVVNMSEIFKGCKNLINLDLSNFNTSNVKLMNNMFSSCINLNNINLSSFNTKNVISMESMFYNCQNLNQLNLLHFNTENVVQMNKMFENCKKLNNLNLSSFNTKNVTDMSEMFKGCINLIKLNISSFVTTNVTNIDEIFKNCKEKIINSNKSRFENFYFDEETQTFKQYLELENDLLYLEFV